jgi:predicted glycosyltransferase
MSEVLHLRKKALVIPRSGPSCEQRMRCALLAARGLIDVLYPEQVTPESLAQRLVTNLARDDYPLNNAGIDTTGGQRAATRLMELIKPRARKVYAAAV